MSKLFFITIFLKVSCNLIPRGDFVTLYEFTHLKFNLSEEEISLLYQYGLYNPDLPMTQIPFSFVFDYENMSSPLYYAIPRFLSAPPFTLGVSDKDCETENLFFKPYPDFQSHVTFPKNAFSAVFATIDKYRRLWVLDNGVGEPSEIEPRNPPKILAYNLLTNKLVHRYEFPCNFYGGGKSLMSKMVVDDYYKENEVKIIISDPFQFNIIVYDMKSNRSHKISNHHFHFEERWKQFTFLNRTIEFPAGVYNIAISKSFKKPLRRHLIFNIFAGESTYSFPLKLVYNYNLWTKGRTFWRRRSVHHFKKMCPSEKNHFVDVNKFFKTLDKSGKQNTGLCDIDSNDILYCGAMDGVTALHLRNPNEGSRFVGFNNETMKFVTDVKVVMNPDGQEELIINSIVPFEINDPEFDPGKVHFRILGCKLWELWNGRDLTSYICNFINCKPKGRKFTRL